MKRKDVISSSAYWTANLQMALYDCALQYMEEHNMNRTQLSEHLGVSRSYVSQLLNGDYDHRISKMFELSLQFGFIPKFDFVKTSDYIRNEECKQTYISEPSKYINVEFGKPSVLAKTNTNDWDFPSYEPTIKEIA